MATTRLAFFGHDAADAAVRRRVGAFAEDGLHVSSFCMRRVEAPVSGFDAVDLGQTFDGRFVQRIRQVFRAARIAARPEHALAGADVIYARNLDMLACAFLAKRHAGLATPVIYECLDVHRLLVRRDPIGGLLRTLERALLRRCAGLVVSSPAFLREHFEVHYKGLYHAQVVENRLPVSTPPRPVRLPDMAEGGDVCPAAARPLRVGWVGVLRCQRSMNLLCALADQLGERVEVRLHGKPARTEIAVFEPEIDRRANMSYAGPYRVPDDLAGIYGGLDVVWSGDFMEAGFNSIWLLPNRLYEGGYHGTPPICVAGTQTARWAEDKGVGFTAAEPLEVELPRLVDALVDDRAALADRRQRLRALPDEVFIQPRGQLAQVIAGFLGDRHRELVA